MGSVPYMATWRRILHSRFKLYTHDSARRCCVLPSVCELPRTFRVRGMRSAWSVVQTFEWFVALANERVEWCSGPCTNEERWNWLSSPGRLLPRLPGWRSSRRSSHLCSSNALGNARGHRHPPWPSSRPVRCTWSLEDPERMQ